jgi:5,10-methylenetetrahydromethanopterin reductase
MDVSLMVAGGSGTQIRDLVDLAVRAEAAGAYGIYVPEAWRSGFVAPTAMAAATRRVRIGAYVLNAHARTPWVAGLAAVDLDEFSGGRLTLGVGSGNRVTNESYQGVPVVRPLQKMRDYLSVLRSVTSARLGERVDVPGERHSVDGWHSQVNPVRSRIPIVLAATSPRMVELAAELADGIALGSLQSVDFVGWDRATMQDQLPARVQGRDLDVHRGGRGPRCCARSGPGGRVESLRGQAASAL